MLTDTACKNSKCPPDKKRLKLSDAGGLYLEVSPNGAKRWFWKYRKPGTGEKAGQIVEGRLSIGAYPAVTLAQARAARDEAKRVRANGQEPVQARKVERLKQAAAAEDTFKAVALEWYSQQSPEWSHHHADRTMRHLQKDLLPWLGARRMRDIEPVELLSVLRKIEARGAVETAHRTLFLCGQLWRYGVGTARADRDIAADLKGTLKQYRGKHFGAITDPIELGALLRAMDGYKGGPVVRAALRLAPILFQRPGELRAAEWAEIDLEAGIWTIPSVRMKRTKDGKENGDAHLVPLPQQAIAILKDLQPLTGHRRLVFPGQRDSERPMSDNSVRSALIAIGYTSDKQTWHGFRATARTIMDEVLEMDWRYIEAQLAHAVRDANGRSYNRTQHFKQRAMMMQTWADYLDRLRMGAEVIDLASHRAA